MSRDGLEEANQLEVFCLKCTFEEDDELCQNILVERSSCSQSDSFGLHSIGLSKPLRRFTLKEKSLASSGLGLEVHLNPPCEASYLKEEDFTFSLPLKQRTSCINGGQILSRAISISKSSSRLSSKSVLLCHSSGSNCQFAALKDEVSLTAKSINAWQISPLPVKELSFRSASLSDLKPRLKFIRDQGSIGVSTSEALEKNNLTGSASAFSFKDISTWNALIIGYCQNAYIADALECYTRMQQTRFSPDAVTFACILKACSSRKACEKGKKIHVEIIKEGALGKETVLGNALVDMYSEFGMGHIAHGVFDEMPTWDVVLWTALIAGYTENGYGDYALDICEHMQSKGISPNAATYGCVSRACGL
ncbi:hypothetical protein L7F22_034165 [Adiantum nelumboides]|nr:hypothetical protein [Adiantum nelumboides]